MNTARRHLYKTLEKEDEDGKSEKSRCWKAFTVFNVEQIDGLSIESVPQPVAGFDPLPQAEAPHDPEQGQNHRAGRKGVLSSGHR